MKVSGDTKRFYALRERVFRMIKKELEEDWGHKSYEGTFEVTYSFPNYFETNGATEGPDFVQLTLHCYVLGPGRNYTWKGSTFKEVLDKAEETINGWEEC